MGQAWDEQREAQVLWIIHQMDEQGLVVDSPAIRNYVETAAIGLGPIPEGLTDPSLDAAHAWILLSLDALRRTKPPLITTAEPHRGDDVLIHIADVRLTEHGRAAILDMQAEASRPPVGFRSRSGE